MEEKKRILQSGGQCNSRSSKQITIFLKFSREFFQVLDEDTPENLLRNSKKSNKKNPTRKFRTKSQWTTKIGTKGVWVSEWKMLLFLFFHIEFVFIECDKSDKSGFKRNKGNVISEYCYMFILIYRNACEFLCYERQVKMTHTQTEQQWKRKIQLKFVYLISSKTEKNHTLCGDFWFYQLFFFLSFLINVIVVWLYAVFFCSLNQWSILFSL